MTDPDGSPGGRQREPPPDDASSPGDAGHDGEARARPMPLFLGFAWTFLATTAFIIAWSLAGSAREAAKLDAVTGGLCQVIGYGITLFVILRVHAPHADLRAAFGLRRTTWQFYALGTLTGLSMVMPVNVAYGLLSERFPTGEPDTMAELFSGVALPKQILVAVLLAGLGPFVEEVLFRGALFLLLRRMAEKFSLFGSAAGALGGPLGAELEEPKLPRSTAALEAIFATALLFAVVHVTWQRMVPILVMGVVLGLLRHASGSVWASFCAHGVFNGSAVIAMVVPALDVDVPGWVVVGSGALGLVLVMTTVHLGKLDETARALRGSEP